MAVTRKRGPADEEELEEEMLPTETEAPEEDDEAEEEGEELGIIDYIKAEYAEMYEADEDEEEATISKAEARRMLTIVTNAISETLYKTGEVKLPNMGTLYLDVREGREGKTMLMSEEDKKKYPNGKPWKTEAKWVPKAKFTASYIQSINDRAEEDGETAQAWLDEAE